MEKQKHYGLWPNLLFLLRLLRRYTPRSFVLLWVSIPVKVALPFIGILLPNLVVAAITEQGSLTRLMGTVLALGLLAVACSYLEQYAAGVMEEEHDWFSQGIDDLLVEKSWTVIMKIWKIRRSPENLMRRSATSGSIIDISPRRP